MKSKYVYSHLTVLIGLVAASGASAQETPSDASAAPVGQTAAPAPPAPVGAAPGATSTPTPAAPPQTEVNEPSEGLGEIVVTARRVAENVQDTPVAVTVITGDALLRSNTSSTEGLTRLTPSLQINGTAPNSGNPSAAQIYIRGIGQSEVAPGVDPGVAIYIDDVYYGSSVGGVMDFRDIGSVQVLRGPQGTLFGRNTIGGAILLTSVNPGSEIGGNVFAGIGSDRLREVRGAIDLPVSPELLTRFSFGSRTRDGYVRQVAYGVDLGSIDSYTITGKAVWRPSSDWRIMVKGDYTDEKSNGAPLVLARANPANATAQKASFDAGCPGQASRSSPVPLINDPRCYNDFFVLGPHATAATRRLGSTLTNWGVQGNIEFDATDNLTLKSISAYRDLRWSGIRDADGSPLVISESDAGSKTWQFSQEFQMTYKSDTLTLVSGLYYFKTKSDYRFSSFNNQPTNAFGLPIPVGGTEIVLNGRYDNWNWAMFTQGTLEVTDRLSITGGLRYTEETKDFSPNQFIPAVPGRFLVPPGRYELKSDAVTGTAVVQYRWGDPIMTYVSYSTGYKAGGWNRSYTSGAPAPISFAPERAKAWELGAKIDVSSELRVNLAAFRTKYDDVQLGFRIGLVPATLNGGRATINGLEGEATWAPTRELLFNANFSYLGNEITDIIPIAGTVTAIAEGNSLPYVPKWQGQFSGQYTADLSTDWSATFRAAAVLRGAQFFEPANSPVVRQANDEWTGDLGVTIENSPNQLSFQIGVVNVTDNLYATAGNNAFNSTGYDEIAYNRGREWFLSVSKRF